MPEALGRVEQLLADNGYFSAANGPRPVASLRGGLEGYPVKSVMHFRQFLLRGLASVRGEWTLVTMVWNIKRLAVMAG